MDQQSVKYATLRDRREWIGVTLSGLSQADDGALSLSALPGPSDAKPILLPGPYNSEVSGIALGTHNELFISDTSTHQVIWHDVTCLDRTIHLGGTAGNSFSQFRTPRGLLIHSNFLYVADSGNARVQIFRLPTLELHAVWNGVFQEPTALAVDSNENIYVLDQALKCVIRFSPNGQQDSAYKIENLNGPGFIAIDNQNRLYVTDASSNLVLRFDANGAAPSPLPSPAPLFQPRALAAQKEWVFVADAGSGRIWVFDIGSNGYLATIPGYRGPVSAFATGSDDSLWIKSGPDQSYNRLEAQRSFIAAGSLTTTTPLDAGEEKNWARVHVNADLTLGTLVQLCLLARSSKTSAPDENDWATANTLPLDTLVPPLAPDAKVGDQRFLWIRALITTDDETRSPRLFQIEAETTSPGYLDLLPVIYRRADADTGFLNRWLKVVQSDVDDWEAILEGMPRCFDPLMTPDNLLQWLASWLAFPLPTDRSIDELRELFGRIPELQIRRGTPGGIKDLVELYTRVRPHIFEAFKTRRVWQLGPGSALGIDTALPAALPDGMIVSGWSVADPELAGLRGDYYDGVNFQRLKATRNDPQLDFAVVTAPAPLARSKEISVRWSGQLQPRSTDLYTFSIESTGGVRLWVDGRLIIDNWKTKSNQMSGRLSLTEGSWYTVVLEYFSIDGGSLHLSWLSRNQPKEIIPKACLYAIRDEHASLSGPTASAPMLVGQTVVGETQPLSTTEYGAPIFSDTAHLFTVSVPAASLPTLAQREDLHAVIENEKPAHTDYHLCFLEPRMRIGFQSQIGIDSIIAGPPAPLSLEGTILGIESFLADDSTGGRVGRVGSHGHIGYDTVVG